MEESIATLLRHVVALRENGVTRVKCGDFEADLAPPAPFTTETDVVESTDQPRKCSLREIVGQSHG